MSMLEDNQWYGTMFPRIPAKHLNEIRKKIREIRGGSDQSRNARGSGHHNDSKRREQKDRSRSPQQKKKRRATRQS